MKVIMFRWVLFPNSFGGLETAFYGSTQGLSKVKDMEGSYVVPKVFAGDDKSNIKLIGAVDGSVINRKVKLNEFAQSVEFIEVSSKLAPCNNPESYGPKIICRV